MRLGCCVIADIGDTADVLKLPVLVDAALDSRDGEPGMVGRARNAEVDAASNSCDGDPGKREVEPRTVGKDGKDVTLLSASWMS